MARVSSYQGILAVLALTAGPAVLAQDGGAIVLSAPLSPKPANGLKGPATAKPLPIILRLSHSSPVYALAYSPDGKTLATGTGAGLIQLWDAHSGLELRRLQGHREAVRSLTFSPDGKFLASSSLDRSVRLWDPGTGTVVRALGPFQRAAMRVAISPDSKSLAVGELVEHLTLWDVATAKELRRLPKQGWISIVAFSPDGKLIATGGENNTIALYDAASGRPLPTFEAPEGDSVFWSAAFSSDGKSLAGARRDGRVFLWDAVTGKNRRKFQGGISDPYCMSYALDGRMLALGYTDNAVGLWEVGTGQPRCWLEGHGHWVTACAFAPDGQTLASAGDDQQVLLWDLTGRRGGPSEPGTHSLPELWSALALPEAARPYRAMLTLVAEAPRSVPFLAERLRLVAPVDAQQIPQLLKDLDNSRFRVRQKATLALEKLGELAEPALLEVLHNKPSLESRQRIVQLLGKLENRVPPPEQLQVLRALEVLELCDAPGARQSLEELAKGPPGSWPSIEAKACLGRLARRPRNHS
jgi:glucose/arabinose dehydrogenase